MVLVFVLIWVKSVLRCLLYIFHLSGLEVIKIYPMNRGKGFFRRTRQFYVSFSIYRKRKSISFETPTPETSWPLPTEVLLSITFSSEKRDKTSNLPIWPIRFVKTTVTSFTKGRSLVWKLHCKQLCFSHSKINLSSVKMRNWHTWVLTEWIIA